MIVRVQPQPRQHSHLTELRRIVIAHSRLRCSRIACLWERVPGFIHLLTVRKSLCRLFRKSVLSFTHSRFANLQQDYHHAERHGQSQIPEEPVVMISKTEDVMRSINIHMRVLQRWELFKVHAKVTGQERQWQEQDGDEGQLLHTLILVCSHGVEDQTDHVITLRAHLIEGSNNHDTVVLHISQICVCGRGNVDRRLSLRLDHCRTRAASGYVRHGIGSR